MDDKRGGGVTQPDDTLICQGRFRILMVFSVLLGYLLPSGGGVKKDVVGLSVA